MVHRKLKRRFSTVLTALLTSLFIPLKKLFTSTFLILGPPHKFDFETRRMKFVYEIPCQTVSHLVYIRQKHCQGL